MGLVIGFELEGEKQMLRRLEGINEDLKDWTPEFKKVGSLLVKTFKNTFPTKGRNIGENWPSLTPSTLAEKARKGYPADPLIRTGLMRKSFKAYAEPLQVMIVNPVPYFKYHQSRMPRKKIPRRVMMKIDNKRKEMIPKIFQKAIEGFLQKRFK